MPKKPLPARARTLMIQGTTSDAGKSTLVAGLCRVLARRGVRVAPFKPQNMALNSAVTVDGGEIGRAQAVQAQACFIEPHTDMNPVLLKPNSDIGAQIIIHGKALADMDARAYHDYKTVAMNAVLDSYRRLREQYDVVLVEGAGSPAEINLRDRDIANMGFAEAVDCPVALIADIDRGGVFAHLVGTLQLLSPSEQRRVNGFIINRFRGDIDLLTPGLDWLENHTGKPVFGVLPYLTDWHLEAEDAIAQSQILDTTTPGQQQPLKVCVPVLPRISNHTDFDALRLHPQVDLQMIGPGQPLPPCDLIVLPGSKSVRSDLLALHTHGWDGAIRRHLRYGGKVLGICGGFQMLGRQVHDPYGIEGNAGTSAGLGLLEVETTLAPEKQLRRVRGYLALGGTRISGYEIHAGVTTGPGLARPLVQLLTGQNSPKESLKAPHPRAGDPRSRTIVESRLGRHRGEGRDPEVLGHLASRLRGNDVWRVDRAHNRAVGSRLRGSDDEALFPRFLSESMGKADMRPDGAIGNDGQVAGTYLHGLFDDTDARDALLAWAGLRQTAPFDYHARREADIDRLADCLEASLDIDRLMAAGTL